MLTTLCKLVPKECFYYLMYFQNNSFSNNTLPNKTNKKNYNTKLQASSCG